MKALNVTSCHRNEFAMKADAFRVSKPKTELDAEMSACFSKLKDLVPTVPQNKRVSKTQLLQHVIDYILDLEIALDFDDVNPNGLPRLVTAPRQPLVENTQINKFVQSHIEKTEECLSRPVSC